MSSPSSPKAPPVADQRDATEAASAAGHRNSKAAPAAAHKDSARADEISGGRVVLDAAGIARAVTRIAHEILERNTSADELCLVAIVRGGESIAELIAAQLAKLAGREIPHGALDITLYRDDVVARGVRPMPRPTRMPFTVEGKRVVLVDDVMFTGRTVRAAMDAVLDFGRPAAIQVAVLVDRGHRELPIKVDFVGKNIPTARGERVVLRARPDGELEVAIV
jgi:pyrimidine operon attenuation protein/uracil phosphoribosyltransferase